MLPNSRAEQTAHGVCISFEFRDEAKRDFEEFTRARVNKRLAIFIDDKLISAPMINDAIKGSGVIEGQFTFAVGQILSNHLNSGALPISLTVTSVQIIKGSGRE